MRSLRKNKFSNFPPLFLKWDKGIQDRLLKDRSDLDFTSHFFFQNLNIYWALTTKYILLHTRLTTVSLPWRELALLLLQCLLTASVLNPAWEERGGNGHGLQTPWAYTWWTPWGWEESWEFDWPSRTLITKVLARELPKIKVFHTWLWDISTKAHHSLRPCFWITEMQRL